MPPALHRPPLHRPIRRPGTCDTLYLDNGATYRGDDLATACSRMGTALVHARPHDPRSPTNMERFWRTLREGCIDHLDRHVSLHDVNARLLAFVDHTCHHRAHASLLGKCLAQVFAKRTRPNARKTVAELACAFAPGESRFIRADGIPSFRGETYKVEQGALRRIRVTLVHDPRDDALVPWVKHADQRHALRLVDAVANSRRARDKPKDSTEPKTTFDPNTARLDAYLGRTTTSDDTP